MTSATIPLHISLPAIPLRAYISHYWLSLDNTDDTYSIWPDGTIDVVVTVGATDLRTEIFGSTTSRADLPLAIGSHYLGIRFRPGQSRHFLDIPASALTDCVQPVDGAFFLDASEVAELISMNGLFARLDTILLGHLRRRPPHHSQMDDVIRHIETTRGSLRISQLVDMYGRSSRQFERQFLAVVGLPAKLFAEINRFQHAATLLAHTTLPLAQIASELGYADQSHLTHEFSRFSEMPPSRLRQHVAFLQDAVHLTNHNAGSFSI